MPLSYVATNFLLTLSNATLGVCDIPEPSVVKFITFPAAAFDALVDNLIVL